MGHQHSPSSQQYENQRNFFNTGANRQIYSDSVQTRPLSRVLHRQPPFYHHQQHHHHHHHHHQQQQFQHHQQQPHPAYRARLAQVTYGQPTVIGSHAYGDLYGHPYDAPLERHRFIPMPPQPQPPPSQQQQRLQPPCYQPLYDQHVQTVPTSFDAGQQLYLQDSNEPDQLTDYYQNDFPEQHQQEQQQEVSLGEYISDEYTPQVPCYREDAITFKAERQPIQPQPDQDEGHPAMMIQPRRHLHASQDDEQLEDLYQTSQQQPNFTTMDSYFRYDLRAGAHLSDEQVHQYDSSLKRPVQTILVQNPGSFTSQICYPTTHDSQYSSTSSSSTSLPPSRDRHLTMDNGQTSASIYAGREDRLAQTQTPSNMNIPYTNRSFDVQQTRSTTSSSSSSSMLSKPGMIVSSRAEVSRDSLDTNERPESILASEAAAHSRADNRQMDNNVKYEQSMDNYSGVYNYNSVTKAQQQQSATLQRSERFQQPFSNRDGSSTVASNGKNQRRIVETDEVRRNHLTVSVTNENSRHLSSSKCNTSPSQEYSDMGTAGNVSQDWLDTICGHLIEHMDNFGICVIDNFLGSIKGELILKEVHGLYSIGRYSKGKLVSDKLSENVANSTSSAAASDDSSSSSSSSSSSPASVKNNSDNLMPNEKRLKQQAQPQQQPVQKQQARLQDIAADSTGAIRNDRVIWVDCEDGCPEINNLIQTLCSVITNSSRLSLYSNNGLDKVNINKRTKAHVACYPGTGTRYIKHVDNPNGDGRVITAIYYLNKNWNTKRDGGLLRMFPAGMDEVANIEPLFDRALFFWSDRRNPHEVLPSYRDRFAITVWYLGEARQ